MAYFPDLSAYAYHRKDADAAVRNVGWLAREHEYPRGPVVPAFAAAVVRCAKRPLQLSRGFHVCDLCPSREDDSMLVVSYGGISARVGNGEIRVTSADEVVLAAPTMLAHYVVDHGYQPPQAFVDAVIERASSIVVLGEDEREALTSMTPTQRYRLCLGLVGELAQSCPYHVGEWLETCQGFLADLLPLIQTWSYDRQAIHLADQVVRNSPPGTTPQTRDLVGRVLRFALSTRSAIDDTQQIESVAEILEHSRELGVHLEV